MIIRDKNGNPVESKHVRKLLRIMALLAAAREATDELYALVDHGELLGIDLCGVADAIEPEMIGIDMQIAELLPDYDRPTWNVITRPMHRGQRD